VILVPDAGDFIEEEVRHVALVQKMFADFCLNHALALIRRLAGIQRAIDHNRTDIVVNLLPLGQKHQEEVPIFIDFVLIIDSQNDIVRLP
jgi:hypothetical protein